MERRGRVVVVSHEATRTGAPRVAIEIVHALRPHYEVVTVLRAGGPLTAEFVSASDRVVREPFARTRAVLRRARFLRRRVNHLDERIARRMLRRLRPRVVYANTVKSTSYVRPARQLGIAVVLHAHEPGPVMASMFSRYGLVLDHGDVGLVACSAGVRTEMAALTGVDPATIELLPSVIDAAAIRARAGAVTRPGDAPPLIAACGTADARKGVDLWLRTAATVRELRRGRPVRFEWVGRVAGAGVREQVHDLGLDGTVTFAGESDDPYPLLASADVVTVPSRADPFPLVVLEAMALGRPVVAYAVDDIPDQVGDAGILVAPGDTDAMARAVVELLDDASRRRALGERAWRRVASQFDIEQLRAGVRRVVDEAFGAGHRPDE